MNRQREHEIREVLADHAEIQRTIWDAIMADSNGLNPHYTHCLIYCEKRQADEIERLFSRERRIEEAFTCPDCGCWLFSEYDCECTRKSEAV